MGQYTAEELERAQAMAAEVNAMRRRGDKRTAWAAITAEYTSSDSPAAHGGRCTTLEPRSWRAVA